MLFRRDQWEAVASGAITVAYRRWTRPTVKQGGRLRTPLCVLAIDEVKRLPASARISAADARAAGFPSPAALKAVLADAGDLYRVRFHPDGTDERVALRETIASTDDDVAALGKALTKLDARTPKRPWTLALLALLDARPATRAAELAAGLRRETFDFKEDVRKLKALGLTESLDVGYRLSPRGRAWLARHRPLAREAAGADGSNGRFDDDVIATLTRWKIVGVRAGPSSEHAHRFVGVWPVVVDRRLHVRSWGQRADGWWRAFQEDPRGAIHVTLGARGAARTEREIDVEAVAVRAKATLAAVDAEYRRKFNTAGALRLVVDLCGKAARATTMELRPVR